PPWFALNDTAIGGYRTLAKVAPPLRSEEDRRALAEAIRDGTIDVIGSTHELIAAQDKDRTFTSARAGGAGLESLLAITLELVHNDILPLLTAVSCLTVGPARVLGLDQGRIAVGTAADLCLFDPDIGWRLPVDPPSPFSGRPVQGRVLETTVGGRSIYADSR
ncbi:MAG: amidohydrolase family protein, partial [Rhodospirillales bacterium]